MADIPRTLKDKVLRLRHQSKPTVTDDTLTTIMRYTNIFAEYYANHGRREWAQIAGSTREKTKLRWSKDGGDVDIIFCSRMLEIPVDNLVHRDETPCFVWIRETITAQDLGIKLIDDKYIPSEILRAVTPDLFTFSRGLYLLFSAGIDTDTTSDGRFTTTSIRSKVGLAVTEFQGLHIMESEMSEHKKQSSEHNVSQHEIGDDLDRTQELPERIYGGTPETNIQSENDDDELPPFLNDLDAESDYETTNHAELSNSTTAFENKHKCPKQYRATYTHKSSKDFVPVLKVAGKLKCMEKWRKRPGRKWPKRKDVETIYKCNVYVVSKYAPILPDQQRDFCLSFNEAEYELSRAMNEVQLNVILILKAYLKGVYTKAHEKNHLELKLTSFHLKTVLYWVSEQQEQSWRNRDTETAIVQVLTYLQKSLEERRLEHYFIKSNLFAGFADEEFALLIENTNVILHNPFGAIDVFFELDDGQPAEILLTEEQRKLLTEISSDGGKRNRREMIRIAYWDFDRADADRDSRIKRDVLSDALFAVFQKWVEDMRDPSKLVQDHLFPDARPEGILKLIPQLLPEVKDELECVLLAGGLNEGATINRKRAMTIIDCCNTLIPLLTSSEHAASGASRADRNGQEQDATSVGEDLIETFAEFLTAYSKFNPDEEEKSLVKKKLLQSLFHFLRVKQRS